LSCRATLVISMTRACKPVHFIHGCRGWVSRREIRIRTMLAGCIGPLGRSSGNGNIAAHWVKPSKWPLGGWRLAQCNSARCALEWLYGQAWIARSISYSHYLSGPSHQRWRLTCPAYQAWALCSGWTAEGGGNFEFLRLQNAFGPVQPVFFPSAI
jgi:hypothetical protein